jgi:hypothetical protein
LAARITRSHFSASRTIFRGYLKLGSLNLLMADLRQRDIVTKVRIFDHGRVCACIIGLGSQR